MVHRASGYPASARALVATLAGIGGEADIDLVVCTKDRPDDLARLLPSVVRQQGVRFRCILVDQSVDRSANERLVASLADDRIDYVAHDAVGKSLALNLALERSTASMLAFTDDDCVLPERWLALAIDALTDADLVFGSVYAAEHDEEQVLVPKLEFGRDEVLDFRPFHYPTLVGMGANMAVRRSVVERVGGFDVELGPGCRFRAGEDCEFSYRALAGGCVVRLLPAWSVVHFGFRLKDGGEAHRLIADSFVGLGVGLGKHVRARDPRAFAASLALTGRNLAEVARRVARRERPLHVRRLFYFWRGFFLGLRARLAVPGIAPLDRHQP